MKKINLQELLQTSKKINFQEILDKITQDKKTLALTILVIVIVLFLDFSFVLKPQLRALSTINPKIAKLKIELEKLNLDSINMQRQSTTGIKPRQIKKLLSPGQVAWVIEEISHMANEHEVEISQIKPSRKTATTGFSKQPAQSDNYLPTLIDLEISAGYHQLGRFLTDLENYSILLEVEELDIMPIEKSSFEHAVRLQIKTYVSK
ncbi:MAG: type 4a pilus biogenesis protein PilO [Candidatus Omnitrophota bacterium]|jgi:Tfp pilus assembly protein PilO